MKRMAGVEMDMGVVALKVESGVMVLALEMMEGNRHRLFEWDDTMGRWDVETICHLTGKELVMRWRGYSPLEMEIVHLENEQYGEDVVYGSGLVTEEEDDDYNAV